MTTLEAPATDVWSAPGEPPLAPPSERGSTTVATAVFERIAGRAAAEVPGVEGEVRTGLHRLLPWAAGSPADAAADVDDDGVVLELVFNVAYPEPVRQVTDRARRHVAERVASLTGRPVRRVDITVPDLVAPARRRPRVR